MLAMERREPNPATGSDPPSSRREHASGVRTPQDEASTASPPAAGGFDPAELPGPPPRSELGRRLARIGYALLAGWVIGIFAVFAYSTVYQRLPFSGAELAIVVGVAVLVPLVVYGLWLGVRRGLGDLGG